ncbi:hypothetical protein CLAFUW4_11800 [Fulvia fulva]|uniref:Uncharacterized protein n=1 Tax=Passalora fulva TaxID=5499 RepID=A0A9Q8PEN1_PASFU|nr:uncharacterized protein CLAFUR5_10843 [Fulvia fulva]KAK4617494.1 hypothetical protein CLAFUR4_11805 [Fulvia fulva]KAK4618880.1 hypothetical protein CLAFUR0_11818 [Fulvia fulva]UJO21078.1 hypothetical protein CLAFUR5_10843 [Fulvia fulva]WPV18695.1 hypothetical protein CLAFUW4_11800 [Fulvia fulva]WPV33021.1 hypothetical protein CLAFUW7_11807 [Fulvia fulva]
MHFITALSLFAAAVVASPVSHPAAPSHAAPSIPTHAPIPVPSHDTKKHHSWASYHHNNEERAVPSFAKPSFAVPSFPVPSFPIPSFSIPSFPIPTPSFPAIFPTTTITIPGGPTITLPPRFSETVITITKPITTEFTVPVPVL